MKIVCSAASCKYSSEDEDSSNIIFISFPNNDTASVWAHNCGRPDLLVKPVQDLHTNQYICSDHIEDQFFISKTNPIVIAQDAVPTLFGSSTHSGGALESIKNDYRPESSIDSLRLTECMNEVDRDQRVQSLSSETQTSFQESTYNREEETENAGVLNFCNMSENIDQFQEISMKLSSLCRMCGQTIVNGVEIFSEKGLEQRLREKINLHTPISVEPDDSMPQKICSNCCDKLEATHSLVVTCLETDMRLRKFSNFNGKPVYHPKFEKLVAECKLLLSNEMNSSTITNTNVLPENQKKIGKTSSANKFSSKWKESSSNIAFEHVQFCTISESTNENMSTTLKYVTHSDLKNLLQTFPDEINPKNNELLTLIAETTKNEERIELICSNCKNIYDSRETYENHILLCKSVDEACMKMPLSHFNCQTCDKSFVSKAELDIHGTTHCERNKLKSPNRVCGYCLAIFDNRKDLQSHINDNHDGQPLYRCSTCEKTYEKWSSLDVHEATHRADKPYLCDLCGKSFKHSNNLRGHKRIHLDEAKKKRHVCDVCGSAFRSRFHLREHANHHNGTKPYTCEDCGKAFYKRIQLRQHRLSHGTKKYECPICRVTFNRRGNMNMHLKRHEKSDGMYTCSVCEDKCKSMSELKMHRKQHSESDIMESIKLKTADKTIWQCKICDKVFPKRAILLNHERTHTGDQTKIECDKCGKKLANKSSLRYHNKSRHTNERPHMCQYCGDAFVSKEARLIHERIHTGERPYTCKICGMQYRCSSNLSQHMKIHSEIRPHVCQYCSKTFSRKGALNVHERIHTGLKPFVCEICNRSFSQKNDMLKHTKTHQGKSMQCEKCDEIFETKSEILKHLDAHEQSAIENSVILRYDEINEQLESYNVEYSVSNDAGNR